MYIKKETFWKKFLLKINHVNRDHTIWKQKSAIYWDNPRYKNKLRTIRLLKNGKVLGLAESNRAS